VMSRGHAEIERLARRLSRHLAGPGPLRADQVDDLRAVLYGLDAVLTLHFAQEEEAYFVLAGSAAARKGREQ
jgi:mannose-6-phosphate isomerase-like protein (cupin superfamily)